MTWEEQWSDPRWLAFRQRVLERDGHKCDECGSQSNLQAHHSRYIVGNALWDYPLDVMRTLCRDCHWKRTQADREMRATTSDLTQEQLEAAIAALDMRRNEIDVTAPWTKTASDFLEELDEEKRRLIDLFARFDAWKKAA